MGVMLRRKIKQGQGKEVTQRDCFTEGTSEKTPAQRQTMALGGHSP